MDIVLTSIDGNIGTITLNRPEKRNALSSEMVVAISEAVRDFGANNSVKVIVLRANGPSFCAGADLEYLRQVSKNSALENLEDSTRLKEMFQGIVNCPKPIVAMVQGAAIAGGCGLASVCDVVVASREHAVFGYSEVRIGFIPAIVLIYLVRKIGDARARHLVLTAENVNAEQAFQIGLVGRVVDHHQLETETNLIAKQISKNSSSAMSMTKMMLSALPGMPGHEALHYAAVMNALARQTDDCKQGIEKFLNPPKESGK